MRIISSVKTKTNESDVVRVEVIYLSSDDNSYEDAVIIQTTRLIKPNDFEKINQLNMAFPIFFALKETKNYALIATRSAPIKLSTFDKIYKIVNEYKN